MDLQKYIYYQCQIDFRYFLLDKISQSDSMTYEEVKKESLKLLRYIIRTKNKLGYDSSGDVEVLNQIKNK